MCSQCFNELYSNFYARVSKVSPYYEIQTTVVKNGVTISNYQKAILSFFLPYASLQFLVLYIREKFIVHSHDHHTIKDVVAS